MNTTTANLRATSAFGYDLNGNLLSDGRRRRGFDYDDENQLIRVTVTNAWKSEFVYDGKMRRRARTEFTRQGGAVATNAVVYREPIRINGDDHVMARVLSDYGLWSAPVRVG